MVVWGIEPWCSNCLIMLEGLCTFHNELYVLVCAFKKTVDTSILYMLYSEKKLCLFGSVHVCVCVCECVHADMYTCVCVCVCVCERERERELTGKMLELLSDFTVYFKSILKCFSIRLPIYCTLPKTEEEMKRDHAAKKETTKNCFDGVFGTL